MADRSLSIAIILNDPDDDVFSVVAEDKDENLLVDVTESYDLSSAELPDGRIGIIVVAKLEHSSQIDPFDLPDQESL